MKAVAVGALPDGTPVIVSGGGDGTVRVWRLADGTPVGEPLTGHTGAVKAVAVGALPDGTPVIVSGGGDGTVRVWRLADGAPVGEPLTGHTGPVTAVAVGALPDGTPVIVSGSDDGTVRVWRLADGTPVGEPLTGHDRPGGGGGGRGAAGRHPGHRQRQRDRRHGAGVAAGRRRPGRQAADRPHRPVGRWRSARCRTAPRSSSAAASDARCGCGGWPTAPRSAEPLSRPRRPGERGGGRGAAGRHPGHRQRQRDGTVRVWRLADGTPVGEPLTGHTGGVRRWRSARCRTAPRSSSAAATTARCGCGGWPTAPRLCLRWT